MTVILTWEHRFLIERVIAQQKATVTDLRLWSKLLDKIGFVDDQERQYAAETYLRRVSQATGAAFVPSPEEPLEYELSDDEVNRLHNALRQFGGYAVGDWPVYAALLETIGRQEAPPRAYPAWFELGLSLQARLQVLFLLKQSTGSPQEAVKICRMAVKFALMPEEAVGIRYQVLTSGRCQWNQAALLSWSEQRRVTLTDAELTDLTTRLQGTEWATGDLLWLNPLLSQLEEREKVHSESNGKVT